MSDDDTKQTDLDDFMVDFYHETFFAGIKALREASSERDAGVELFRGTCAASREALETARRAATVDDGRYIYRSPSTKTMRVRLRRATPDELAWMFSEAWPYPRIVDCVFEEQDQ